MLAELGAFLNARSLTLIANARPFLPDFALHAGVGYPSQVLLAPALQHEK